MFVLRAVRRLWRAAAGVVPQLARLPRNLAFAFRHRHLRGKGKILYAITPPPRWKDVGDHAQVVAIRAWMNKHFAHLPVLEVDKDQARYFLPALRWLVRPGDMLFLHSGGNLGDRGKWSEGVRRLLIQAFPGNGIVQLPQTIYFSDTRDGRREQARSRCLYAAHPDLTIIARDPLSADLAAELFPGARRFCTPDFALSMPPLPPRPRRDPPRVLLCLRQDNESVLTRAEHAEIARRLPYPSTFFDTVAPAPIPLGQQEEVVARTLAVFSAADVVVTDRYHGLMFAVLCRKPCVALRSADHKIVSGMHWFRDVPSMALAQDIEAIPRLVDQVLAASQGELPDWNAAHFDRIPAFLGLDHSTEPARAKKAA